MTAMRYIVSRCVVVVCWLLVSSGAAPGARTGMPGYYPLRPGNWWLYRGPARVSWKPASAPSDTDAGRLATNGTASCVLKVRVEVTRLERLRSGLTLISLRQTARPADPCAYPGDAFASWLAPERTCACLLEPETRAYYRISPDLAAALRSPKGLSAEARERLRIVTNETAPQFVLPLRDGQRYADKAALERGDDRYQWVVSKLASETVCGVRYDEVYTLRYRCNPDDETMHFVPHLGVTRRAYQHSGTIIEWDLRLVDFRVR